MRNDDRWCLFRAGLAVSTDAHSIDAFQCMRFEIDQARPALADGKRRAKCPTACRIAQATEAVTDVTAPRK